MKYLVLLVVVLIVMGVWRSQRPTRAPSAARPTPGPQDMVACAHCGVHVPRSDALTHGSHAYCCADHQRQAARPGAH